MDIFLGGILKLFKAALFNKHESKPSLWSIFLFQKVLLWTDFCLLGKSLITHEHNGKIYIDFVSKHLNSAVIWWCTWGIVQKHCAVDWKWIANAELLPCCQKGPQQNSSVWVSTKLPFGWELFTPLVQSAWSTYRYSFTKCTHLNYRSECKSKNYNLLKCAKKDILGFSCQPVKMQPVEWTKCFILPNLISSQSLVIT